MLYLYCNISFFAPRLGELLGVSKYAGFKGGIGGGRGEIVPSKSPLGGVRLGVLGGELLGVLDGELLGEELLGGVSCE